LEKNGLKLIILFEKLFGLKSLAKIYQTDNSKEQQGIQAMHNSQQFMFLLNIKQSSITWQKT
jgi:hypothetical protein